MNRLSKVLFGIVFSFIFCFTCIGYAQLSNTLTIEGSAEAEPQEGVFISDVDVPDGVNASINSYLSTLLNSTVELGSDGSSTVSFEITVYNNSEYVHTFNGVQYSVDDGTYDNENIQFTLDGLKSGDEIAIGEYLTFNITFSYKDKSSINETVLNSLLNFEFVPADEYIPEIAASGAMGKFAEILNDSEDYAALIGQMDKETDDRANDSYIGNVVGGDSEDTNFINDLFTEDGQNYLTLNINGVETNVTAMIKRENLDGDTSTGDENGDEMTIYMTAEDIPWYGGEIVVYAAVFTKNGTDGQWEQVGEMYEGTADANNYTGGWGRRNSFDTDTWSSSVVYYNVTAGSSIGDIIAAVPET